MSDDIKKDEKTPKVTRQNPTKPVIKDRAAQIKQINAEAAKNMLPGIKTGSNELKAATDTSIMGRLKTAGKNLANSAKNAGIATSNKISNVLNGQPTKPIGTVPKPEKAPVSSSPGTKSLGLPNRQEQMNQINSDIKTKNVKAPNVSSKNPTQVQNKTQGALDMPGINAKKPKIEKSQVEMLDLLKSTGAAKGKPGASEAAKSVWSTPVTPQEQQKVGKPVAPASVKTSSSVTPPAVSKPAPVIASGSVLPAGSSDPKPVAKVPHKELASHMQHNKIKDTLKTKGKPKAAPSQEAHGKIKAVLKTKKSSKGEPAPATAAQAPEKKFTPGAQQNLKSAPKAAEPAKVETKPEAQRSFESNKVLPKGSPAAKEDPVHSEVTRKPTAGSEKTAKPGNSTPADANSEVTAKPGEKPTPKKDVHSEETFKPGNSAPVDVNSEVTAKPGAPKAAPAKVDPKNKPTVEKTAKPGDKNFKVNPDNPSTVEKTAVPPPPPTKSKSDSGSGSNLGVKTTFVAPTAHSHVMNFLKQMFNPGSQPSGEANSIVSGSQHFMQKSEIQKGISDHLLKLGQAMGAVAKRPTSNNPMKPSSADKAIISQRQEITRPDNKNELLGRLKSGQKQATKVLTNQIKSKKAGPDKTVASAQAITDANKTINNVRQLNKSEEKTKKESAFKTFRRIADGGGNVHDNNNYPTHVHDQAAKTGRTPSKLAVDSMKHRNKQFNSQKSANRVEWRDDESRPPSSGPWGAGDDSQEHMVKLKSALKSKQAKQVGPSMVKSEEKTEKESLGATASKIKESAQKKPAAEKAKLLTTPENYPEHNRKKVLSMLKNCAKIDK